MNAAALPMEVITFEVVSRNDDGSFLCAPCLSRALAEDELRFLNTVVPGRERFIRETHPVLPGLKGQL